MKEFILSNWQVVLSILFMGSAVGLPVTRKALKTLVLASVNALFTEDMIIAFVLNSLEKYVKRTNTKLDDKWFENLKKELGR